MAEHAAATSVSVLCAHKISSIYNFEHRFAHYIALAIVLVAPRHRWITPAAFAFAVLYTVFSTLYVGALSIAPTRLGPSLDVFALNSIFLTNTYALAAAVFCTDKIKGRRGWLSCIRGFFWLWTGFITASLAKSSFEKWAQQAVVEVQCFAENATDSPASIFSIGKGLVCENPCAIPEAYVAHRLQEQLTPLVWGSLETSTMSFSKMAIPALSVTEYAVVILFALALASTLWVNFFTSPQITRNTIFASLAGGKTDSRVRAFIAKVAALTWYTWSYLVLSLLALSTPFVSYVQEKLLARYPVTKNGCLIRQWLPFAIGVAIFLVKVAFWRRRREVLSKEKACRIRRFNTALRQLQGNAAANEITLLPEPHRTAANEKAELSAEPVRMSRPATPRPATPVAGLQQTKKHRIEIAETRNVRGLKDAAVELKEWWCNPMGLKNDDSANPDEEKALLKGHY